MSTSLPIIRLPAELASPASAQVTSTLATQSLATQALATQALANDILSACTQSGFFYLSHHGIPNAVINAVREAQRVLFAQADTIKDAISINQHNRGYLAQGKAKMHGAKHSDQKEVFFWGREYSPEHRYILNDTPLCGFNQWPGVGSEAVASYAPALASFRHAVLDYAAEIERVGNALLSGFAVALGAAPDFFTQHYSDSMLRGQLIRYPVTQGGRDSFGVAPHTDFGCITLLLQETEGLEVLCHEQWIQAPPIEGTLVVNIGDLLQRWSNNRLPSTRHRVRNENPEARYSIAMFHDPAPDAVVDPTDIDSSLTHSEFEPITAADYILSRNKGAFDHYRKADTTNSQR